MALSERLNTPISTAELERRWTAVRAAMAREKIDVLLMQNNNDHMGGYVRYFTDMPATNGYPNTVVFPRDDEMTVVCQGPFGGGETTAQGDVNWRGVEADLDDAELCLGALHQGLRPRARRQGAGAVPPTPPSAMSAPIRCRYALLDYIKRTFPKARYVDASDMVDQIKVIKSAEEMELVKRAALMQDGAMRAAFAAVKPGMRDTEVAAVAQHYSQCPRQRERHLSLRLDAARQARRNSPTAICRTASSRKATRSRCWSRTTGPAACTPSSAAPAWSAPRCRRR